MKRNIKKHYLKIKNDLELWFKDIKTNKAIDLKNKTNELIEEIDKYKTKLKEIDLSKQNEIIKKEIKEIQNIINNIYKWIKNKKNKDFKTKIKKDFNKINLKLNSFIKTFHKIKNELVEEEYIKIPYEGSLTPIIFNRTSSSLEIWDQTFKLSKITIKDNLSSNDIKINDFLIKKHKPILSILIPSLTAKELWLAKNTSKHLILEWIIKREDIKEIGNWLLMYGKWEFKLKMNNLDVKVEIEKI